MRVRSFGQILLGTCIAACFGVAAASEVPGREWSRVVSPAAAGWSVGKLRKACEIADDVGSTALLVVQHGRIVWECGNIAKPYRLRSIRKSLLNGVVGQLVHSGQLSLDATLGGLGVREKTPLTRSERSATVRDLLRSRSGVYLPAVNQTDSEERPARGSHAPGSFWYYNNWDFNVLGTIVEKTTGQSLFKEFERRIARPIGMQDFDLADTYYDRGSESLHPAYEFNMSARDLARIGLLYLNKGKWGQKQVLPRQWVADSIAPHSLNAPDEQDYGLLWWSQAPIESRRMCQRSFLARGWGYQWLWVFPEDDLIIVNRTDYWFLALRDALGWLPAPKEAYGILYSVLDARPPTRSADCTIKGPARP